MSFDIILKYVKMKAEFHHVAVIGEYQLLKRIQKPNIRSVVIRVLLQDETPLSFLHILG